MFLISKLDKIPSLWLLRKALGAQCGISFLVGENLI